ncbi:MAG: alpha/beta fold hydrolase [Gemmatimonadota bacterium]|nr:alpha/beta fold hydrolase [Gemmatimonadota bacterium]
MRQRRSRHRAPDRCYPAGDERVRTCFVRLRSGLQVRVVECGPSDGPPVVLLPGWAASAFTYRHQLPALGAAGFRAVAVDLKGHGFSDKPTGRGEYTFAGMLRHVGDVMDAIAPAGAAVVAQSMSGALAVQLTLTENPRITHLVLINPVGLGAVRLIRLARLLTPRLLNPIAPYFIPRWIVRAALRRAFNDTARVTPDDIEEYWAAAQFPGYSRALRALVNEFTWAAFAETRLAALRVPTLVILGARDRLLRGSRLLAERLPGARVVVIEDGGHAVNEERPEPVNAAILEFLGRRPV